MVEELYRLLSEIADPEIPVVNIVEMGMIRNVEVQAETICVYLTPTYSGCPAMAFIEERIKETLAREGTKVVVKIVLSPPWTTDWMSDITKAKLRAYGIAPPEKGGAEQLVSLKRPNPVCPNCGASDTKVQSEFGSTPCKSFLHCNSCHQPFEAFKSI